MKKNILFTILLLFIVSCTGSDNSSELSKYVDYNTKGTIGVKMPVIINLAEPLKINEDAVKGSVSITPDVKFKTELIGGLGLKLTPLTHFDYDKTYKISIDLKKLAGIKESGIYSFEINTPKLSFSYNDGDLSLYSIGNEDVYYLTGNIYASDYTDSLFIRKNTTISGDNALKATWTHSADGMTHTYRVDSIKSKDKDYNLTITHKHDKEVKHNVVIPAKGDYRILKSEVMYEPLRIVVTFSSAIDGSQKFSELVSLENESQIGENDKLTFTTTLNHLTIYPSSRLTGNYILKISELLKNEIGEALKSSYTQILNIADLSPSIELIGKGNIMPTSGNINILFQSVNYQKAQVRVKRIYENNIVQFFQTNNYDGDNIYLVSRIIADTTITLGDIKSDKLKYINNYGLQINKLIQPQPGAIYRIEIKGLVPLSETEENSYSSDYYFGDYKTYEKRSRNILVSDIGIIAKGNDNKNYTIFVTNLLTATPVTGAKVEMLDEVNQLIGTGTTDSNGKVEIKCEEEPNLIIATYNGQKSYLKTEKGLALSMSNFDVAGNASPKGIKGFIFGERGVWRPGDDIYITFIAMYDKESLPDNHPAILEFRNPQGQIVTKLSESKSSGGIYCFKLKTDKEAPTGNWESSISFGGEQFKKIIKIETIKPNRLKIALTLNDTPAIPADNIEADIYAEWLHGATGKNMDTKIDVELSQAKTTFNNYKEYSFDDETKTYGTEDKELFKTKTDSEGKAKVKGHIDGLKSNAPGMLNAKFTVKVFEPSGDFSIDQYNTKISPYTTYVGINVKEQKNDWGEEYLDINKPHNFNVAAIDINQKPRNIREVKVELYKMEWNWWWNSSSGYALAQYAQNSYNRPIKTFYVDMQNGKATFPMKWNSNEWGLYLIRVTDTAGGHSATKVCHVDYGYGRDVNGATNAATRLLITKDKKKYNVGETANLSVPSAKGARILVTLETGSKVLKSMWIECNSDKTNIAIPLDDTMTPNVYANIMLIQPHSNTQNDAPIRMYGVERINVEDKNTRLQPIIEIADEVKPESEIKFGIKETNGKEMSYVVAIVDEGLLGLTRYKTPDVWNYFYADEALGIRTWDLYDLVIGAYGGRIEQIFAIGGDDELVNSGSIKAERFKPVVEFIGVSKLEKGKTASHTVKLPPYIGAVRVMVIASEGRAKGSADKSVKVRKPLMIQTTLPRVMGVSEEITVPVTVFAMKDNLGKVNIELKEGEGYTISGEKHKSVTFDKTGEKVVYFNIKTSNDECITKITVNANSSDDKSVSETEIDIRNSNPRTSDSRSFIVKGGEKQNTTYTLTGIKGTNRAKIELSTIPAINLNSRLNYLVTYPHGCIEQITSSAFAQLYIGDISNINAKECEENVKATLNMLNRYQLPNGSFSYWSGGVETSQWGTIYAGHFMTEAAKKGYSVNKELKDKWLRYMKQSVNNNTFTDYEVQSYALYTLSAAGEPQRGAMNRMREKKGCTPESMWFLAGAYAKENKINIAQQIISQITEDNTIYNNPYGITFYSPERSDAVILTVLTTIGEKEKSFRMVQKLAAELNNNKKWMSTQSTAWVLNAISSYIMLNGNQSVNANVKAGNKDYPVKTTKAISEIVLNPNDLDLTFPVTVENKNSTPLYVVISSNGIPQIGEEKAVSEGLKLNVKYSDINGNTLNPSNLKAGTDFVATIKVSNTNSYTDYTNIALNYVIPSGWEIQNKRLNSSSGSYPAGVTYQDIRDDRVYSYFDLRKGTAVTVKISLTATYKGKFYLPSVAAEVMYDGTVRASTLGQWCTVD